MNEDELRRRFESRPVEVSSFAALSSISSDTLLIPLDAVLTVIESVTYVEKYPLKKSSEVFVQGAPDSDERNIYKIVLVGPAQVGKTSFLSQLFAQPVVEYYVPTIGVEFMTRRVVFHENIDDASTPLKHVMLQLWDTAGQERFRAIARSIYHGAVGFMFFFNVNDTSSFDEMKRMVDEAMKFVSPPNFHGSMLIGTKADVGAESQRQVQCEDALDYATKLDMPYFEVSFLNPKKGDDGKPYPTSEDLLATLVYYKLRDTPQSMKEKLKEGTWPSTPPPQKEKCCVM
eukprot:PhF_6_TR13675/c0_g1_i4/m.21981